MQDMSIMHAKYVSYTCNMKAPIILGMYVACVHHLYYTHGAHMQDMSIMHAQYVIYVRYESTNHVRHVCSTRALHVCCTHAINRVQHTSLKYEQHTSGYTHVQHTYHSSNKSIYPALVPRLCPKYTMQHASSTHAYQLPDMCKM